MCESDENAHSVENAGGTELSPNVVEAYMKDIAETETFGEDESNTSFSTETEITITNKDACNDNLEPSGNKTDESFLGQLMPQNSLLHSNQCLRVIRLT